ncbi:uncharacterized protein LOC106179645 [Lingula anatina]|uniref:XK-related protein n=1 Tax=Lingula anatina TaxID=7574 RepID=A0A1S3K8I9_LINAN|nr:uncharacterized protein LOC106179645 [Lingula anatina]XP_013418818.1 uncharacterized protein LOC106179645 [Lingula anatina]|eukprot:XP_013418817.1 uncharacterized protein LOC106179645 [Lingula anatina]
MAEKEQHVSGIELEENSEKNSSQDNVSLPNSPPHTLSLPISRSRPQSKQKLINVSHKALKFSLSLNFLSALCMTFLILADMVTDIILIVLYYQMGEGYRTPVWVAIGMLIPAHILMALVDNHLFDRVSEFPIINKIPRYARFLLDFPLPHLRMWGLHLKLIKRRFLVMYYAYKANEEALNRMQEQINLSGTKTIPRDRPDVEKEMREHILFFLGVEPVLSRCKLFQSMLESAPQLMVNLFLLLKYQDLKSELAIWQMVSGSISMISLVWGIVAYQKSRPGGRSRSACATFLYFIEMVMFMIGRLLALVYCALCFQYWILIVIIPHGVVYFISSCCRLRQSNGTNGGICSGSFIRRYVIRVALSIISIFCIIEDLPIIIFAIVSVVYLTENVIFISFPLLVSDSANLTGTAFGNSTDEANALNPFHRHDARPCGGNDPWFYTVMCVVIIFTVLSLLLRVVVYCGKNRCDCNLLQDDDEDT